MDPRYQFAYLTDLPQYVSFSDFDFPALEHAAGLPLSWEVPLLQQEMGIQGGPTLIINAVNGFLEAHRIETEAPTLPGARKYYLDTRKHAKALSRLLNGDDPTARRLRAGLVPIACDFGAFQRLLKEIEDRADWNHDWLTKKQGKAGRPEMLARQGLLVSLFHVWKRAGGEGNGIYWSDHHKNGHKGPYYELAGELVSQIQRLDKLRDFPGLAGISDGLNLACAKVAKEYQPPDTSNLELRARE